MKSILSLVTFTLIFASQAHAEIRGSTLDPRHEALVENAVYNKCLVAKGYIELVSVLETPVIVDQGVIVKRFEIKLLVHQRVDQMIYDIYAVTVKSYYSEVYNSATKDSGVFSLESVSNCIQQ